MFPNSKLDEAYGSTEAGCVTILKPEEQLTKLGSCGREVIGTDLLRLYDEDGKLITEPNKVGEVYSRSPMLFSGYWNDPEKTAAAFKEAGYFSAGDMGYRDEEGYVILVDRKANMIISGGVNVYPREIEEVLYRHPAVSEASVIGLPDEHWGEIVKAVIVLKAGAQATEDEIKDFCGKNLAGFKKPKSVDFWKELPKSPQGKILKTEIPIPGEYLACVGKYGGVQHGKDFPSVLRIQHKAVVVIKL